MLGRKNKIGKKEEVKKKSWRDAVKDSDEEEEAPQVLFFIIIY